MKRRGFQPLRRGSCQLRTVTKEIFKRVGIFGLGILHRVQ